MIIAPLPKFTWDLRESVVVSTANQKCDWSVRVHVWIVHVLVCLCVYLCVCCPLCVYQTDKIAAQWQVIDMSSQSASKCAGVFFMQVGANESVWMCLHSVQNFCLLSIASVSNGQNCCLHACVQALNFLKRGWFLEPPEMRSRNGERSPSLHQVCVCWRCLQYLYIF